MAAEVKDVTPTKERVRVAAGRQGGPMQAEALPRARLPAVQDEQGIDASVPANFLAVVARAAADPRCDTAKMQALLDMQRQIEDREAKKAYTRAFRALQKLLPTINRDGKIEVREKDRDGKRTGPLSQSTPYATYPAIMEVVKPLLDDHDFTLSSVIEPGTEGKIDVVTTLAHGDGFERISRFPLGADTTGSKNNAQGWGSSQQYGMRYNAIALLNIVSRAPQDRDNNGYSGDFQNAKGGGVAEAAEPRPAITSAQRDKLVDLITAAKIKEQQFCVKYGINQIIQLPADLYDAAVAAIEAHRAGAAAAKRDGIRG
jgi:ERF superfamily